MQGSHLDMEFSEVRSLGERIVLKFRLGCDTARHKETKSAPVNTGRCKEHSANKYHCQSILISDDFIIIYVIIIIPFFV